MNFTSIGRTVHVIYSKLCLQSVYSRNSNFAVSSTGGCREPVFVVKDFVHDRLAVDTFLPKIAATWWSLRARAAADWPGAMLQACHNGNKSEHVITHSA